MTYRVKIEEGTLRAKFDTESEAKARAADLGDGVVFHEADDDRQWAVIADGRLIRTYGREEGARDMARQDARECGWGTKAVLYTQARIDALK